MNSLVISLLVGAVAVFLSVSASSGRPLKKPQRLADPLPGWCRNRPRNFYKNGHYYSVMYNKLPETTSEDDVSLDKEVDIDPKFITLNWLASRNLCRKQCMEPVSIQTESENEFVADLIQKDDLESIWTSGRLCDFKGCEGRYIEPIRQNGWFWLGTNTKIPSTEVLPPVNWKENPWSTTGYTKEAQPDNVEFRYTSTTENCIAILNNYYKDGVKWHDTACYHNRSVICEDSDLLISYIEQSYGIILKPAHVEYKENHPEPVAPKTDSNIVNDVVGPAVGVDYDDYDVPGWPAVSLDAAVAAAVEAVARSDAAAVLEEADAAQRYAEKIANELDENNVI